MNGINDLSSPAILHGKINKFELSLNQCISALLSYRCTQGNLRFINIVRRKHHVPVHGVPSTAIIVPNYVRYDAKTSLDY